MELLQWYNLVFVLPFVAGMGYLLMLASGLVGEHGVEADADADADVGVEADGDLDHDFDHGVEHTVGHEHSLEHDNESMAMKALSFLGFGKIPLSLILLSMCFIWGFTGWAANMFFAEVLRYPALFIWPSLAVALFCSTVFTRATARMLARFMPSTESYAETDSQLLGRTAEVRYTITKDSGTAILYDGYRNLREVQCVVNDGEEHIPAGTSVVLTEYDKLRKVFHVRPNPLTQLRTT